MRLERRGNRRIRVWYTERTGDDGSDSDGKRWPGATVGKVDG